MIGRCLGARDGVVDASLLRCITVHHPRSRARTNPGVWRLSRHSINYTDCKDGIHPCHFADPAAGRPRPCLPGPLGGGEEGMPGASGTQRWVHAQLKPRTSSGAPDQHERARQYCTGDIPHPAAWRAEFVAEGGHKDPKPDRWACHWPGWPHASPGNCFLRPARAPAARAGSVKRMHGPL